MAPNLNCFVIFAVCSLPSLPYSFAQKNTGDIHGTVTDPSDALIPGCAITLTDQDTGAVRKTTSDAQGAFSFLQLPVGTYTDTSSKYGFKTISQHDLPVHGFTGITTIVR